MWNSIKGQSGSLLHSFIKPQRFTLLSTPYSNSNNHHILFKRLIIHHYIIEIKCWVIIIFLNNPKNQKMYKIKLVVNNNFLTVFTCYAELSCNQDLGYSVFYSFLAIYNSNINLSMFIMVRSGIQKYLLCLVKYCTIIYFDSLCVFPNGEKRSEFLVTSKI